MTMTEERNETMVRVPARAIDMKLEIVVIPVSDVDRAKAFYASLGWRVDADFTADDDYRVIQFTPPGSGCSVIFGNNVTAAAPGSAQGLYLIVSDIDAARNDLVRRGVQVSEAFMARPMRTPEPTSHICLAGFGSMARIPNTTATVRSPPSMIRTATAGYSRRSRSDCRGGSKASRPSAHRLTLRARYA